MFSLDIEKDLNYVGKNLENKNDKKRKILKQQNRKLNQYQLVNLLLKY